MRANNIYKQTNNIVRGADVIGEMIKNTDMIIPMAIDSHSCMGSLMMRLFFGTSPNNEQIFKDDRRNAAEMNHRLLSDPYPNSILVMVYMN